MYVLFSNLVIYLEIELCLFLSMHFNTTAKRNELLITVWQIS